LLPIELIVQASTHPKRALTIHVPRHRFSWSCTLLGVLHISSITDVTRHGQPEAAVLLAVGSTVVGAAAQLSGPAISTAAAAAVAAAAASGDCGVAAAAGPAGAAAAAAGRLPGRQAWHLLQEQPGQQQKLHITFACEPHIIETMLCQQPKVCQPRGCRLLHVQQT